MTHTTHTQLPWRTLGEWAIVSKIKTIADLYKTSADCDELDEIAANARFIVTACNSHYELLDACELVLGDMSSNGLQDKVLIKLQEAINKAKGL